MGGIERSQEQIENVCSCVRTWLLAETGVVDCGSERYPSDGEPAGLAYVDWIQTDAYDPVKLKADFHAQ